MNENEKINEQMVDALALVWDMLKDGRLIIDPAHGSAQLGNFTVMLGKVQVALMSAKKAL